MLQFQFQCFKYLWILDFKLVLCLHSAFRIVQIIDFLTCNHSRYLDKIQIQMFVVWRIPYGTINSKAVLVYICMRLAFAICNSCKFCKYFLNEILWTPQIFGLTNEFCKKYFKSSVFWLWLNYSLFASRA